MPGTTPWAYRRATDPWFSVLVAAVQVASPLVTTMIIQFIVPPSQHVVKLLVGKLLRKLKAKGVFTQNALIRMYDCGLQEINAAYGEVLLGLSVVLVDPLGETVRRGPDMDGSSEGGSCFAGTGTGPHCRDTVHHCWAPLLECDWTPQMQFPNSSFVKRHPLW